jgi:Tol biopolymer transport system component
VHGRTLLVLAVLCLVQTGCFSRRGGTVGPEPVPYVPGIVVFASDRDEAHGEIYSMLDDGTHVTRLTFNAVKDATPLLSPDGTKITFRRDLNPSNVFLMNVNGSNAIGLAPGTRAEWSPDGSKLALVADSLAVMNSDATGIHRFGVGASYVTWSPDGTMLAYVSTGLGGQAVNDIYTIGADGNGAERVTTDGVAKNSLAWSPDGTKLLYTASQTVYVIPASGGAPDSPCAGRDARWSPDGQRIIFVTDGYDGNDEVYAVLLDGTDLKNLSENAADDTEPDWRPRE